MKLCYYEHIDKSPIVSGGDRFSVRCDPVVHCPNFVTIIEGEQEHCISATFDFSKLPNKYHSLGVQMVRIGGGKMHLAKEG